MRTIDGRRGHGIGINGTAPGPLIRLREGQRARLHVENRLDEATSIHWHGLLLVVAAPGSTSRRRCSCRTAAMGWRAPKPMTTSG